MKKKKLTAGAGASRKQDHIDLTFRSQISAAALDGRFSYEPLLAAHPVGEWGDFEFLGKRMRVPIWVSSMTGGTGLAQKINHNLARVCREFGMGMGLGSCRILLSHDERFSDFDVRSVIGDDLPLYAYLGIAQLESVAAKGDFFQVAELVERLQADGLIIHVNPLQEAMQPEGDVFARPPIETIEAFLEHTDLKIIVKEVGQGMGYSSLKRLLELPLEAVEFAASGGTNFPLLELLRGDELSREVFAPLARVGHSAEEMILFTNLIANELGDDLRCKQVIVSGGVKHFLDGYYLIEKSNLPAIYGQASGFLKHAKEDYQSLHDYVEKQVLGLKLAKAYLRIR